MNKIRLTEKDILCVVDPQLTFMPGGGLAVPNGDRIVLPMRRAMNLFPRERRYATKDRHPKGHISLASSCRDKAPFSRLTYGEANQWKVSHKHLAEHALFTLGDLKAYLRNVGFQILWTDHALEETEEAEFHPEFLESEFAYVQVKGMDPTCDSYSGFYDNLGRPTGFDSRIRNNHGSTRKLRLFCGGLARNICVAYLALDGKLRLGFEDVFLLWDASEPVGQEEEMIARLDDAGVHCISVDDLVTS